MLVPSEDDRKAVDTSKLAVGGNRMESTPRANKDDFEIDIVAETLDGNIEAYEVKRNPKKYSPARLEEKIAEMKRRIFRSKEVIKGWSIHGRHVGFRYIKSTDNTERYSHLWQ